MPKTTSLLRQSACAALRPRPPILIASRGFSQCRRQSSSTPSPKKDQDGSTSSQGNPPPKPPSMEDLLANTNPQDNSLLAPVHIPEDANAILKSDHPATDILSQSGIVVQRQLEMMNVMIGFEQANRYVILDPQGNHIGYMAEHEGGIGYTMRRQFFNTHRAFTTHVFNRQSREVLRFHRPFSWINTRIRAYDPWDGPYEAQRSSSTSLVPQSSTDPMDQPQISPLPLESMRIIGETHSQWAPLRRKYDLFLSHDLALNEPGPHAISTRRGEGLSNLQQNQIAENNRSGSATDFTQFAAVNEPFLSWDFSLLDQNNQKIGSVNREFRGFGREIFTDTGSYVLRMDAAGMEGPADAKQGDRGYAEALGGREGNYGMTLDQRAVMLATAVTIDYDYFSRHSGGHGFFPLWFGGGAGEAAGGAAGAGAAGEAGAAGAAGAAEAGGAVVGGAGRAVGSAAGGAAGVGEGAMAGAGTMAGYEAMQRGMGRRSEGSAGSDEMSPQQQPSPPPEQQPFGQQPYDPQSPQSGFGEPQQGEEDVWGSQDDFDPFKDAPQGGGSGGGEGGGGGGWFSDLWDSFWNN
ncbi:uncharacterized protein Z520_05118 [Fonsecaea multimorphosa CBS 102226]|uniref:Phospholipid scramblase n=1 Tax=Fonsecaea multimorphosa CBS 102226 TaxID=1442371 RepID=A0A0D2K161_9EURO|nr:uncharacterized protein Z520_05118 [Fonsecaea multimorphosa CBS 102226]KIX99542.1 hypothetical protein Z520_05118 [Fonsecaea multimorphosa CBS 102226]